MTDAEVVQETGLIVTPTRFATELKKWEAKQMHVLSPFFNFAELPAGYSLLPTAVKLSADPLEGDVYQNTQFCKPHEVAIAKNGLMKIADCAGADIDTEDLTDPAVLFYWKFKATVKLIGLSGTPRRVPATRDWDLRDESPLVMGWKASAARKKPPGNADNQIREARRYGMGQCEVRAINAAVRAALRLKQKYKKTEFDKPFVVLQMMFQPDQSDPAVRLLAAQNHYAAKTTLYPGQPALAAPSQFEAMEIVEEPEQTDAELAEKETEPQIPDETEKPDAQVVYHVTHVAKVADGWYITTKETGDRRIAVEERATALAAHKAMEEQQGLDLTIDTDGKLVSLEPAL